MALVLLPLREASGILQGRKYFMLTVFVYLELLCSYSNTSCFLHWKGAAWHTVMQGLAFVGYIWHLDVVWSYVRNLFHASAFFYNRSSYNSFLLGALWKDWLKEQNKAGEVWLGLDAQCYNLSDIWKSASRIPPDFISLSSQLSP